MPSHFRVFFRAGVSTARFAFQLAASQPVPIIRFPPDPFKGGFACVPYPVSTNFRNRPTVISYRSSRKLDTVAG